MTALTTTSLQTVISKLGLQPHPEGGYYKETYRTEKQIPQNILGQPFKQSCAYSTAIYYLLESGQHSRLHKIASDEVWHFYSGQPLVVVEFNEDGLAKETIISNQLDAGHTPQHVVKAGHWFGAYTLATEKEDYSLVGCTVSPGFNFEDLIFLEGDYKSNLLKIHPKHEKLINRLTPTR